MSREVITDGKTFVFIGSRESKPELARRWLNYGFNDYVEGRYSRSFYDYISYVVDTKANDDRGQWVRAWMQYGYTLGILYYECFHPDLEPQYNAFRKDAELLEFLNIDYTKRPPGYGDLEAWELYDITDLYSIVRVKPDTKSEYKAVDFWHSGTEYYRDVMDTLVKLGYPENYEIISFYYWRKGAKN